MPLPTKLSNLSLQLTLKEARALVMNVYNPILGRQGQEEHKFNQVGLHIEPSRLHTKTLSENKQTKEQRQEDCEFQPGLSVLLNRTLWEERGREKASHIIRLQKWGCPVLSEYMVKMWLLRLVHLWAKRSMRVHLMSL